MSPDAGASPAVSSPTASSPAVAAAAAAAGASPADGPRPLGPRPAPDPVVMAMVAAALEQLRPVAVPVEPPSSGPSAWRFSGRWWHKPVPARRDRPWTGG